MAIEPFLSTRAQRMFFGIVIIQALAVLAMVGITYGKVAYQVEMSSNARYKTLPCFLALFALAEVFEVFMVFDALRLRNIIQLFGITCFHSALVVMAAIQVGQTRTALIWRNAELCAQEWFPAGCDGPGSLFVQVRPFLIVAPVIIGVSLVALVYYLTELYTEFGWAVFHVVGANPRMKTMYQFYQVMICLLKFDFFFFTGVTMQLLILVLKSDSAEFGITVAAIPVVLILLILCAIAVQREIKWLMSISLVMMLASLSYFIYKLIRFFQPSKQALYATTRASLTIFTICAFLLLFATFGVGLRCFSDFDKGLAPSKIHSAPKKKVNKHETSKLMNQTEGSAIPLGPRISIE